MNHLPEELLEQIAVALDTSPPSITRFTHEPSPNLTRSKDTPLKALSLVSSTWRRIVVPILFQYVREELDTANRWVPTDARLFEDLRHMHRLGRLSNHEVQIYQTISQKMWQWKVDPDTDSNIEACRLEESDNFLASRRYAFSLPYIPGTFKDFDTFMCKHSLKPKVKSLVISTDKEYDQPTVAGEKQLQRRLWEEIFSCLDTPRLVVSAPPTTLAALLGIPTHSFDTWAFEQQIHYLELSTSSSEHCTTASEPSVYVGLYLMHHKGWDHIAYNEGASIPVYSTYEFHLKRPFSPLVDLLTLCSSRINDSFQLRSFSFIGLFPLSSHVVRMVNGLEEILTLRKVRFQLAPGPENDLLNDQERLRRAQPRDLWLEWTDSYIAIGSLMRHPSGFLRELISTDDEDPMKAAEVENALEKIRHESWTRAPDEPGKWIREA